MGDRDTDIRAGPGRFPSTQWSMILGAQDSAAPAFRDNLERLIHAYWKPIYVFIRAAWARTNEDAKDLTQDFLARLVEGGVIDTYSREKGRFRGYLKGALRHFLINRDKAASAQKRGGERAIVSLDAEPLPVASESGTPEEQFDRSWAQTVLNRGLEDVRVQLAREGLEVAWRVFELYDLSPSESEEMTYRDIADKFGLGESEVKRYLTYARLLARNALQRFVAETVASEEELFRELKDLFD